MTSAKKSCPKYSKDFLLKMSYVAELCKNHVRSDDSQCRKYCTFHYPFELPSEAWSGQANGLFCVSTMFNEELGYNPDIYLWNPLVSKFGIIPGSPLPRFSYKEIRWNALAFGFLPEVNDYVVVHVVKPSSTAEPDSPDADYYAFNPYDTPPYAHYPHSVKIGVYSLNTNSWKEICQDNVFVDSISTDASEFVNGTAFWVGYNYDLVQQVVMYFDTKTNVLGQISVPNRMARHTRQLENPVILPFGQSIAYFVEGDVDDWDDDDYEYDDFGTSHLDIWVLNDERRVLNDESINEDFWENKMRTYEDAWKNKMSVKLSENISAEVLGTRNNGAPILAKSNNLISYDLDTHEPYDFVESCDRLTQFYYLNEGSKSPFLICPFVETLALLDID
ncbi:F-box/kelch-repeat protein At3g06240-like [Daucus carota subsp. sativus]|uniref:F-box/kelch-repeat protein At3g06240-like n=1 Tax=Daucus carota subsp. sativus TaxID=79200 RepID=UPI0007F00E4D|nr:PREDICTED: F-box/kelch-repeat protein At3g06240-like [Daucus carota subsp. sativus]